MSWAATGLKESARIAMPSLVFRTMWLSASIRISVTPKTMACETVIVSPEIFPHDYGISSARSVIRSGKDLGSAPKTYCPAFSRNRETPIAVISTVSFGRSRNGR